MTPQAALGILGGAMEEKRLPRGYPSWRARTEPEPRGAEALLQAGDEELIRLAQGGRPQAVSVLYMRYRRKVLNFTYRLTGNYAKAEEVTQETFLRVVKHLHSFRPTGSVAGWIFRIARNQALNSLRGHKGVREVSLEEPVGADDQEGREGVERGETLSDWRSGPAEEAKRRETEQRVQEALLELKPVFREVVVLCDIQGIGYKEAAELLRCSINTVASRLARGRMKLARLLGHLREEL